jgi:hypothetical protein
VPLPNNDREIRVHLCAMLYMSGFINTGSAIQTLMGARTYRHTHSLEIS